MTDPVASLGVVGGAGLAGGFVGWAMKKVLKIVAFLIGLEIALLAYLASTGIIVVDWEALNGAISGLIGITSEGSGLPPIVAGFLTTLPVSAPFTLGLYAGFRRG